MKNLADIQELNDSIIDCDVEFRAGVDLLSSREWLKFRKEHRSITQPVWITKRLVIDSGFSVYNSRTKITLILN